MCMSMLSIGKRKGLDGSALKPFLLGLVDADEKDELHAYSSPPKLLPPYMDTGVGGGADGKGGSTMGRGMGGVVARFPWCC